VGEIKAMEKKKNNDIRWLGLILTKKSAIYLSVLSSIGFSFFASSIMFTFPVLRYNMTNIYPYDKLTYFYTILFYIIEKTAQLQDGTSKIDILAVKFATDFNYGRCLLCLKFPQPTLTHHL